MRAYAPGEYKVLVSTDGGNFHEAACWRSSLRSEVSYEEIVLFKDLQAAKAVAIVMKTPMPWGYFGLNGVSVLTDGDEAFMIVRSAPSRSLEECLVVSGTRISAQTCLDAVAAGDGRDVFKFQDGNLIHAASGLCVSFARGSGDQVGLRDCTAAARADDGRAAWELTAAGQMKLTRLGNYCLNLLGGRAAVDDCGASSEKFAFAVVPELDLRVGAFAQDQAKLLVAAAKRQRRNLHELRLQLQTSSDCRFADSFFVGRVNVTRSTVMRSVEQGMLVAQKSIGQAETAAAAIEKIYSALGVDMADVTQLIGDTSAVLEAAQLKFIQSA